MSLSNNIIKGDSVQVPVESFDFLEMGDRLEDSVHPEASPNGDGPGPEEEPEEVSEEDVVARLQRELEERLLEIDARAREVEEEAYRSGFEQGYREGREKAEREIEEQTEPLRSLLEQLSGQYDKVLDDYRQWLIEAAVAIAGKLVHRETLERPGWLADLVERALNEAKREQHLTVFFHPEDLRLLDTHGCLEKLRKSRNNLVCEEDRELERGGCRIESEFRVLDCSLETRSRLALEALNSDVEASDG